MFSKTLVCGQKKKPSIQSSVGTTYFTVALISSLTVVATVNDDAVLVVDTVAIIEFVKMPEKCRQHGI